MVSGGDHCGNNKVDGSVTYIELYSPLPLCAGVVSGGDQYGNNKVDGSVTYIVTLTALYLSVLVW